MSEDLNTIEPVENQEQSVEQNETDFSGKGLKELVENLKELLEGADMQKLQKDAEAVKAAFYKTLRKEKVAIGGETEMAEENNPFAEIENVFKSLYSQYKEKKSVFTQEMDKMKEENLKDKEQIVEELKALVEKQDDVSQAFPLFRELQNRWRATGPVPQSKVKNLYETYQHYVEKFYDLVKINQELRDLDFKKNLEAKEELCRKAEELENEENVVGAFRTLQKLHEQWKELGPVNKENREQIWERFKAATAAINKKHQAFFETQKDVLKENLEAKAALCEKVEEIAKREIKDSNAWNALSKEIEEIQKQWKKIGFATKKDNQKIYDRFRAACDEFFSKKRDFYSDFKGQMQDNMAKKIELCEKAEALKESEDWKATSEALIELQKQWKEIGPISRKKSEQIWKRFRAACDEFFDKRDKAQGGKNAEFYENLQKKRDLIDEIKAFANETSEDVQSAFKEFQSRWNSIGFVPMKEKDKIQESFKKALNEKFGNMRDAAGRAGRTVRKKVESERDRLVQKYLRKEQEIATYENNMGFFSKSKNADALLEELHKKIDEAREELAQLEATIKEIDKQQESQQD